MERHNVESIGYYIATRLAIRLDTEMEEVKDWKWYRYKEAERVLNKCMFAATQKKRMRRELLNNN